ARVRGGWWGGGRGRGGGCEGNVSRIIGVWTRVQVAELVGAVVVTVIQDCGGDDISKSGWRQIVGGHVHRIERESRHLRIEVRLACREKINQRAVSRERNGDRLV